MHNRMFVTTTMPTGTSSHEVRDTVFRTLSQDQTFCGDGGRFGSPLCDWFVIGGRWSGYLAEQCIGDSFNNAVVARFPEMGQPYFPMTIIAERGLELDALWKTFGGTGSSPYTRSSYNELGEDDDAMLITQPLYNSLLAPFEGESITTEAFGCEFADLHEEVLEPSAIGNKWLVVIDYHC